MLSPAALVDGTCRSYVRRLHASFGLGDAAPASLSGLPRLETLHVPRHRSLVLPLGHFLSGRVDSSRRDLDTDPATACARNTTVIRDKGERIAIQGSRRRPDRAARNKLGTLKRAFRRSSKTRKPQGRRPGQRPRAGSEMQESGADKDAIHADADYQQCLSAFNDFSSRC